MEILGYLLSALVGLSLGLIGGGGSILMVPILVYVMGLEPVLATSYSLFIVGITALVGAFTNYRKGLVSVQTALLFGLTSIATVFISRWWLIPVLPEVLVQVGDFSVSKSTATMVLFAVLMLGASFSMIADRKKEPTPGKSTLLNYPRMFLFGILTGLVTGLLGAGGGFLIIPVLVLIFGLPMKQAVGTSLLIIAMNSLIGFTGDLGHYALDWTLLLTLAAIAVVGIFIGSELAKKINSLILKKAFGWFVLAMGGYILLKELFL